MLADNGRVVKHTSPCFMTNDELKLILQESNYLQPKWKLFVHILAFTGMRPSEVLALNVTDFTGFQSLDFSKATIRLAKTNKVVGQYFIEPLAAMIREYVIEFNNQLSGLWLFPTKQLGYFRKPTISVTHAGAMFAKLRKKCAGRNPDFLDLDPITGKHRIRLGTFRHWFQTHAVAISGDPFFHKELMNYSKLETAVHYVNFKSVRERIPKFMEDNFGGVIKNFDSISKDQRFLGDFDKKV